MKMRSRALTMLCLLATLLITKGSAGQRGSQAGGALCPGGLCSTTTPPAAPSPLGDGDITDLITSSMFDTMLPNRKYRPCHSDGFYTYDAFITAAKSFPTFATTGDTDTRKRELAAFFGQTSQQTSAAHPHGGPYVEGYCYVKQQNPKGDYCDQAFDDQWPCAPGKQYYGRGPIQLSYNYNYGQAGVALGLNRELLTTPDLVENESVISFKTALWFWMTPQPPKPSCHDVITGNWIPTKEDISAGRFPGYGVITNIINSLECGHGQDASDEDRIGFYKRYCSDEIFDVRTGDNLDCKNQAPFGTVPALDSM